MKRGEIWWADLRPPRGSGSGYLRPVLVVQSDDFNRSKINTVVVVILTSNLRLQEASGNVFLIASATGLPRDSVTNVSQIITLDRSFLTKRIARLSRAKLREVEEGLRLVLAL